MTQQYSHFSPEYIEACFFAWYENKGKSKKLNDGFPPDSDGNIPSTATVRAWITKYGWQERADVLDAEVSMQLERDAVQRKAEATRKLAEVGQKLVDKGIEYLENESFDSASAAVRAITAGADMMAKYVGMGDLIIALSKMNDAQLTREFYKLLGKGGDSITVEQVETSSPESTEQTETAEGEENAD